MKPLLGAHVSTAGGLHKGLINGDALGANVIQIFGASPRQWAAKLPSDADLKVYQETKKASGVKAVYLHAAYLVNIASPNELLRARSVKSLTQHLTIASLIEAQGLIFHIGSAMEQTRDDAIAKTIEEMRKVLANVPGTTPLVMENAAGGGQKIGAQPQEFGTIMRALKSPRVKVCFDTAHAFEAGIIDYTPQSIKEVFDAWDKEVGLENIVALHANDSKTIFNSRNDKHENIGEGHIGLAGFKNLAREKRLHHAAWILEVPGFEGFGPDKKNLDILKSCFEKI